MTNKETSIGKIPAFPFNHVDSYCDGMTYRQWLIGMIASGDAASDDPGSHEEAAEWDIARADDIIARLDAETDG